MDAKYDANFNPNMLAYNPATDSVENVKSNAAGDAILVELVAMVNEYKTAISGADTTPNYLEDKLVAGSGITITKLNVGGNEQLQLDASGLGYYQEVQQDGIAFTQRNSLNFTSFFDVTDNAGNDSTDVTVDVTAIASDNTFISALTSTATFLENIANSSIFVDTLIGNTYFLDELVGSTYFTTLLANDSNFVSELTSNTSFITSISGTVAVVTDGVTITGDGTVGDPLTATSLATGVQSVTGLDTDNTDTQNPVVKIAVDGVTITGQGTPADPLVSTGGSARVPVTGTFAAGVISGVLTPSFTVTHGAGYIPSEIIITAGFDISGGGSTYYSTPMMIGNTYIDPTDGTVIARITNGGVKYNSGGGGSMEYNTLYTDTASARVKGNISGFGHLEAILVVSNVTDTTFDVALFADGLSANSGTLAVSFNWVAK